MKFLTLIAFPFLAWTSIAAGDFQAPVRLFILAGQSNMEGKAPNALFEHQAVDPGTRDFFAHLRRDGAWIVRDDVFMKFLDRRGPLTIGYGSPERTGPEWEFGSVMGDHIEAPVILVKIAWGGRSLCKDFRSPSAGLPDDAVLQAELRQAQDRVRKNNEKNGTTDPIPVLDQIQQAYGASYREMLSEVRDVMERHAIYFPQLQGRTVELAGCVWFQGWNDQYGGQDEYAANLRHFIRDVRRDLHAPELPFVIGAMGQNGSQPATGPMRTIQQAQLGINDDPEFRGRARAIRTDTLVDTAAEALYPTWEKDIAQWKRIGGDRPYHYLGSAIWFTRIGHAMGEAMRELTAAR